MQYRAVESGNYESCAGDPGATGVGELLFPDGRLRFTVLENRVVEQAALSYTGRAGGTAAGVAYVNSSDPAGLMEQCATTGLTSSPVDIVFQTTPSISGWPAAERTWRARGWAKRRHQQLTASGARKT